MQATIDSETHCVGMRNIMGPGAGASHVYEGQRHQFEDFERVEVQAVQVGDAR
jgi:hypothetical protein